MPNWNLLTEVLDKDDIKKIKRMINDSLSELFYTLYVKRSIWKK